MNQGMWHDFARAIGREDLLADPRCKDAKTSWAHRDALNEIIVVGPGTIVSAMHDNGLEVRHEENLREHYAMTLREWGANLERGWDEAVAEAGEHRARLWRLYMAASRFGFDMNTVELHEVLGARVAEDGRSGMPLRADWETRVPEEAEARAESPVAA